MIASIEKDVEAKPQDASRLVMSCKDQKLCMAVHTCNSHIQEGRVGATPHYTVTLQDLAKKRRKKRRRKWGEKKKIWVKGRS